MLTTHSYAKFMILNGLWNKYISEIVPHSLREPATAVNGPTLLKADYHGSLMTVEDCRCASRIGISGICVKETKNMFEIVTTEDRLIKIPKEKSLFRIRAKLDNIGGNNKEIEWRLWGDQFSAKKWRESGKEIQWQNDTRKGFDGTVKYRIEMTEGHAISGVVRLEG